MSTHDAAACAPDATICPHGKVNLSALRSVGVSPTATPTRTPRHPKDRDPDKRVHNSWERGIATEDRPGGFKMPYLNEHGTPVGVKQFAEKRNTGAWDHPGKQVSTPQGASLPAPRSPSPKEVVA